MKLKLLYIASRRFGPWRGREWKEFLDQSGMQHLKELVSLDGNLCPPLIDHPLDAEDWEHVEKRDYRTHFFTDLDYLLRRVAGCDPSEVQILGVMEEPDCACNSILVPGFEFKGYDLLPFDDGNSILSGCGWQRVASEVNDCGLLDDYDRAQHLRKLWEAEGDPGHAGVIVWAIWRLSERLSA